MISSIKEDVARLILTIRIRTEEEIKREDVNKILVPIKYKESAAEEERKPISNENKVGRNAPRPCGSGKKYNQCCGK